MMTFGSLFAGIGGFDLGLERAGMICKWQVENNPFCTKVLEKHWPTVKRYGDIRNVEKLEAVDLICGGFPCQPFSCAGQRRGKDDDRFLWPEMLRIIREVRPAWIIGENVAGIIDMALDDCISDLENEGYEVQPFIIPACALNAPHRRDRVWICAHSLDGEHGTGRGQIRETNSIQGINREALRSRWIERADSHASDTCNQGLQGSKLGNALHGNGNGQKTHGSTPKRNNAWDEPWIEAATRLCRMDDGVSSRVHRLRSLGNAVVPQIVEVIGRAIMEVEYGNR